MRIITFDLSLTAPAVCCDGITDTCDTRKLDGHQRLQWIVEWVTDWTTSEANEDLLVGIEGYSHASKFVAHRLGELGGLVRHSLWRRRIPYVNVPPTVVKKYATGKGNAPKDAVLAAAFRRGDMLFDGDTNDQADAFWIWALLTDALGTPVLDMPAAHRTALDKVVLPDEVAA